MHSPLPFPPNTDQKQLRDPRLKNKNKKKKTLWSFKDLLETWVGVGRNNTCKNSWVIWHPLHCKTELDATAFSSLELPSCMMTRTGVSQRCNNTRKKCQASKLGPERESRRVMESKAKGVAKCPHIHIARCWSLQLLAALLLGKHISLVPPTHFCHLRFAWLIGRSCKDPWSSLDEGSLCKEAVLKQGAYKGNQ